MTADMAVTANANPTAICAMTVEYAVNFAQSGSHQCVHSWTSALRLTITRLLVMLMSCGLTYIEWFKLLLVLKLVQ